MTTPQKKLVSVFKTSFDPDCRSLSSIIAELQNLVQQYGEDAHIEQRDYEYSDTKYFAVLVKELETDAQFEKRIAQEAIWQKAQEARDRLEYERLQQKFGPVK